MSFKISNLDTQTSIFFALIAERASSTLDC